MNETAKLLIDCSDSMCLSCLTLRIALLFAVYYLFMFVHLRFSI